MSKSQVRANGGSTPIREDVGVDSSRQASSNKNAYHRDQDYWRLMDIGKDKTQWPSPPPP